LLSHNKPAAAHVTPENVEAFVAELKERVSSVTVYGSIHKLRRASELMAPGQALIWLREIENNLALDMRPRSKFDRLVLSEVLFEAGLSLIVEGETATKLTDVQRAPSSAMV
jgi:hypothetical protein